MFRGAGRAAASGPPAAAADGEREHRCPGLRDALARALGADAQPRVLDLGSRSGPTAVFLAGVGARVSVDLFDPPRPETGDGDETGELREAASPHAHLGADGTGVPVRSKAVGEPVELGSRLRIDHPDGSFDLVLAWDLIDFTPPARLHAMFAELARVLAPNGAAMFLARDAPNETDGVSGRVRRYEVIAEDLVRSRFSEDGGTCWCHPSRKIEQALGPLGVRQMHLQRERVREYVVARPSRRGT